MERLRTKLWKRRSQPDDSINEMETDEVTDSVPEEPIPQPNPSSILSFIPYAPSFLSRSQSSEPIASTSNATEESNMILNLSTALTEKVDLLTVENLHLQQSIIELSEELESLKESQASLISKSEDLSQSLSLERKRFLWQKNFYEKKILDLALACSSNPSTNGHVVGQDLQAVKEIFNNHESFYHETILELVAEQENKESQLVEVKAAFEQEIKRLTETHEITVAELIESNHEQVKELIQSHEDLVKDLLTGCEGLFDEMKVEYLRDAETNTDLKAKSGIKIWEQFQSLSSQKKGIVVAGVCIITVATAGWASWGFIVWVWPRLLIFAESVTANPQVLARWLSFLVTFLSSAQFQSFVKDWEEGKPLGTCLKSVLNSDVFSTALQLAPNLFAQLKGRNLKT